jgi:uncharacterized protein (TIGR03067 family)
MKPMGLALAALVTIHWSTAGAQAPEKKADKLDGTWVPSKLVYNGKDLTNDNKVKFKLVFKGKQVTVAGTEAVEKEYAKLTFKLDPSTTPKLIDLTVSAGIQKDAVMEGIYELTKDELKICTKVFGKDRPAEFSSPMGSSIVLLVLKRDKTE